MEFNYRSLKVMWKFKVFYNRLVTVDDMAGTIPGREGYLNSVNGTHFGGCQSLCLLNWLRSKNTLK